MLKRIAVVAAMALAAAFAGAAAPAHAAPAAPASVVLGSGWTTVVLHAYSGGGCAWYGGASAGSAFYSQPCGGEGAEAESMSARLTSSGDLELALLTAGLALTISGGEWKWETANSNTTVFSLDNGPYVVGGNTYYELFNAVDTSHYMGPNGEGALLKDITPTGTLADSGWTMLSS